MRRLLVLLATVTVLTIAVIQGGKHPASQLNTHAGMSTKTGPPARDHQSGPAFTETPTVTRALQSTSLAGTRVPAELLTDAEGHLIVASSTLAIIEYFLSLSGELPDARIHQQLRQWAEAHAGPRAAEELAALLQRYESYRQQLASGDYAALDATEITDKLRQRQRLREALFGRDAAALFAEEDRYDQFSLKRHAIFSTPMSDQDREQALQHLYASQPEHLAAQYQQQHALHNLPSVEQAIQADGGGRTDRFRHYQETFGDAAALRLRSLNQERQEWKRRYRDYAAQRDHILAAGLSPTDKQAQLTQLRTDLFSGPEQQRVAALDRLHARDTPPGADH